MASSQICILIILQFLIVPLDLTTACTSRRCLADILINKKLYSAPQAPQCVIGVNLTSIQYETLSVDTRTMQFSSRIKINMEWTDPDLAWPKTVYGFDELVLPVNKIWTPDLTVENAVYLSVKPTTNDILVRSDGTLNHDIVMYTTVVCRINLFTYPFVDGACPVAINGWNQSSPGCAVQIDKLEEGVCWEILDPGIQVGINLVHSTDMIYRTGGFNVLADQSKSHLMAPLGSVKHWTYRHTVLHQRYHVQTKLKCVRDTSLAANNQEGMSPIEETLISKIACALQVAYGSVLPVGSGQGEWETISVVLHQDKDSNTYNYLHVSMSTNPFKAVVSLVLPSGLIMVADLVSFALPLDGGKRSSFKITLVLSFTMFLLILTDYLPNSGHCSPLIRYHFCFCLFFLVLSMLVSMVCTKVATDGNILPCKFPKLCKPDPGAKLASVAEDRKGLEKIANFVERMEEKEKKLKKRQNLANKLDKICFWSYLGLDVIYSLCVIGFTKTTNCKVDNLDFWQQ